MVIIVWYSNLWKVWLWSCNLRMSVWYCKLWNEYMVMQLRIECMEMDACNCKLWYGCMVLKLRF